MAIVLVLGTQEILKADIQYMLNGHVRPFWKNKVRPISFTPNGFLIYSNISYSLSFIYQDTREKEETTYIYQHRITEYTILKIFLP